MRLVNKILGMFILALVLSSCSAMQYTARDDGGYQDGKYVSDQEFYDQLSPYGTWVDDPRYGTVWVPDVDGDFRPYATNGHWVMTDYGNTWVSDYPWGWAAFHYGRWNFDDYYGWEWIPGNEWAPAWVSWRGGDEYYGWAPLTPGLSFDVSYGSNYYIPDNYWVFAPQAYVTNVNVYNYCVPYNRVRTIIPRTSYIRNVNTYNNHRYYVGPRRDELQRFTRQPINVYNIRNVNRPTGGRIENNVVNIYRPDIRRNNNARPARVVDGAAYQRQNPGQRINDGRNGGSYNRANASRLAQIARDNNPDNGVVRVNNNQRPAAGGRPIYPGNRPGSQRPAVIDNNGNRQNGQAVNNNNQQQQADQQRQQQILQQQQQRDQQMQQRRQARDQAAGQTQQMRNRQQFGQMTDEQRQQMQQQRDQMRQQRQQNGQQMTDEQRQQMQQQRDQMRQQRQQQDQQRQQQQNQQATDQQRQQMQQQREQQRQQMDQQRQQQQQQRDQQRQQMEQQRQQQQNQQATDQQRQQMQQQREQQRQQMEQQRQQQQQQREQQRQQMEQQRQQQQQQRQQADQQRQQQRQQQEQQRQQQEQQRQQQQDQQRQGRPGRP